MSIENAAHIDNRTNVLYPEYVEAKMGFRNHWYPTLFSAELAEGAFKPFPILGDRLFLARVDGNSVCRTRPLPASWCRFFPQDRML